MINTTIISLLSYLACQCCIFYFFPVLYVSFLFYFFFVVQEVFRFVKICDIMIGVASY